jgi:hypothetical protein
MAAPSVQCSGRLHYADNEYDSENVLILCEGNIAALWLISACLSLQRLARAEESWNVKAGPLLSVRKCSFLNKDVKTLRIVSNFACSSVAK